MCNKKLIDAQALGQVAAGNVYRYTWDDIGCRRREYDSWDGDAYIETIVETDKVDNCVGKQFRIPETGELQCEPQYRLNCVVIGEQ